MRCPPQHLTLWCTPPHHRPGTAVLTSYLPRGFLPRRPHDLRQGTTTTMHHGVGSDQIRHNLNPFTPAPSQDAQPSLCLALWPLPESSVAALACCAAPRLKTTMVVETGSPRTPEHLWQRGGLHHLGNSGKDGPR
jgi:hypothetical protein